MSDNGRAEVRHPIGARGSLSLRNVSGRIRLVGIDGDEAIVRVTAHDGREPRLNIERSEGGLLVEPERSGLGLRIQIGDRHDLEFEVEVPRGARLDVKTVSGDIDGRELGGEQQYKTVSGDIRLAAAAGRVSAMTVSGDVRLNEGSKLDLDAATTSGDVSVDAEVVGQLGVRTISGDVRLSGRLASGPRHSVETVSGDLLLELDGGVTVDSSRAMDFARRGRGPTVVGDGSARLLFRSMSGDQRVRLRGAAAAFAEGTTSQAAGAATEASPAAPLSDDRLDVLRALERGEIDVEEASRRLEVANRG